MGIEITQQFENEIAPFVWVEHRDDVSAGVCLTVDDRYLQDVFDTRAEEGFIGNGCDWGSLAQVFLEEKCSGLQSKIIIDSNVSDIDFYCTSRGRSCFYQAQSQRFCCLIKAYTLIFSMLPALLHWF